MDAARFPGRTAVTVSFGGPGVALAYMASRIEPATPIVFLDTGFLFPETYALRDELVRRYELNLVSTSHSPIPVRSTRRTPTAAAPSARSSRCSAPSATSTPG